MAFKHQLGIGEIRRLQYRNVISFQHCCIATTRLSRLRTPHVPSGPKHSQSDSDPEKDKPMVANCFPSDLITSMISLIYEMMHYLA